MSERTHERFAEDIGAYVLGALPEQDASELARHAATCPACHAEIERLRVAAEALPLAVPQVSPSPRLKRSLMRAVAAESRGRGRPALRLPSVLTRLRPAMAWVSAAFLLAVGIAAGAGAVSLLGEDDEREMAAQVDERRMAGASATLMVPERKDQAAVLRVHGLPSPGPDRVYQVWLQRGTEVVPGALFSPNSEGTAAAAIPDGVEDVDAVMVTRERRGGARAPSENPVLIVRT